MEAPAAGFTFLLTLLATISLWPLENISVNQESQYLGAIKYEMLACMTLEEDTLKLDL